MEESYEWFMSICDLILLSTASLVDNVSYYYRCVEGNVQIWFYTPNGRYVTRNISLLTRLSLQSWLQLQNLTYGSLIKMLPAPNRVPIDESWELLDFSGRSTILSREVDLYEPDEGDINLENDDY